ncbi:M14 family metallopeptidase [Gracilimonas amylolytica]|uniref:M14 family metallopeptidase n=1 Tax=Gracilimonas amylolytica TaxID=1749045 RepID=UPI000CD85CF4|nr:M14 family metallopeptidase [Gracilimonas amylolytica]
MRFVLLLTSLMILLTSCKSTEEFSGFSYDPPDVTDTTDKELTPQYKRVIGTGEPTVWVSNMFDGARLNDFYAKNDSLFEVYIRPENAPINNSPWYAFKIWSDTLRSAKIKINYQDATHRYVPKLHRPDSLGSVTLSDYEELAFEYDSTDGTAVIELELSEAPLYVSAQPLQTTSDLMEDLESRNIVGHDFVKHKRAGLSKKGREIMELEITEVAPDQKAPVLAIVGRQHPPEVTGYLASLSFLEELTSDTELAEQFRNTFVVKAFPMINPDGVDLGHWRHNAGGIDLNRDWENFNQPETRVVRDALSRLKDHDRRIMFYAIDFHSTNENLFYPINEEVKTTPDNITQKWIPLIKENNADVEFTVEEFDTSSPIAKNWFYHTFGIDAVTYEVDDRLETDRLDEISRSAARSLMQLLLEEWHHKNLDN